MRGYAFGLFILFTLVPLGMRWCLWAIESLVGACTPKWIFLSNWDMCAQFWAHGIKKIPQSKKIRVSGKIPRYPNQFIKPNPFRPANQLRPEYFLWQSLPPHETNLPGSTEMSNLFAKLSSHFRHPLIFRHTLVFRRPLIYHESLRATPEVT